MIRALALIAVSVASLPLASLSATAAEAILTGPARTIDGDTIEIVGVSVRLKGIAAPERDEPGGAEATKEMRRLVGSQEVRCQLTGERTHRRAVGYCSAGGTDLNGAMVRGGWDRAMESGGDRERALDVALAKLRATSPLADEWQLRTALAKLLVAERVRQAKHRP